VTANGDVRSIETARECLYLSEASAVMVGRAAVGQPWLVGRIAAGLEGRALAEPDPQTKAEIAIEHYEGLLGLMGRQVGTRHARKHLAAYAECARSHGFALSERDRLRLVTTDEPALVVHLLRRLFASDSVERTAA
jgi:tRNA-dihydrouridine synthase B